jgi:ABC-type Fe3+-hydroxamate transport system substrate-binding protein
VIVGGEKEAERFVELETAESVTVPEKPLRLVALSGAVPPVVLATNVTEVVIVILKSGTSAKKPPCVLSGTGI